jgi:probable addiction module antidote protein
MQMKDQPHDDSMASLFREDPELAAATLDAILADGDQGELLVTLRQMAKAFGGVSAVAKSAELNPTQLYRTLSEKGNPELKSLTALLRSMGLRLSVRSIEKQSADA